MKNFLNKKNLIIGMGVLAVGAIILSTAGAVMALAPGAVNLGTADNFAVLAGSAVNDSNPSVVVGDVGLSPTTGAAIAIPQAEVTGTIYAVDGAGPLGSVNNPGLLTLAKNSLTAAYTDASTRVALPDIGTDLAAQVLTAGVYHAASGTFTITGGGTLTLDGQNNSNSVFIFKTGSTLVTSTSSKVVLINGAQACNVFWAIGSSATLDTTTTFVGTIMAVASITDNTGSTINGRLLADADNNGIGAVTLNATHITKSNCAPSLQLLKTVTNNNGGTAVNTAWTLTATGASGSPTNLSGATTVSSDVTFPAATFKADTYTLAESGGPAGYTAGTYSCVVNGNAPIVSNSLTLVAGDSAICTVNNDDIVPIVVVPPSGGGGNGGHPPFPASSVPPFIDVVKVPSPMALPNGPGLVTYFYTLRNIGTVPVNNITMVDDSCSPMNLISGDVNNNSTLEVNEIWKYSCATVLSKTHTNTVTATGWANSISATDIASATVTVGVSAPTVVAPVIIPKLPNTGYPPRGE
ncbi:MAG: ice-binding family protein [Patescibacteria group bacterium]